MTNKNKLCYVAYCKGCGRIVAACTKECADRYPEDIEQWKSFGRRVEIVNGPVKISNCHCDHPIDHVAAAEEIVEYLQSEIPNWDKYEITKILAKHYGKKGK